MTDISTTDCIFLLPNKIILYGLVARTTIILQPLYRGIVVAVSRSLTTAARVDSQSCQFKIIPYLLFTLAFYSLNELCFQKSYHVSCMYHDCKYQCSQILCFYLITVCCKPCLDGLVVCACCWLPCSSQDGGCNGVKHELSSKQLLLPVKEYIMNKVSRLLFFMFRVQDMKQLPRQ